MMLFGGFSLGVSGGDAPRVLFAVERAPVLHVAFAAADEYEPSVTPSFARAEAPAVVVATLGTDIATACVNLCRADRLATFGDVDLRQAQQGRQGPCDAELVRLRNLAMSVAAKRGASGAFDQRSSASVAGEAILVGEAALATLAVNEGIPIVGVRRRHKLLKHVSKGFDLHAPFGGNDAASALNVALVVDFMAKRDFGRTLKRALAKGDSLSSMVVRDLASASGERRVSRYVLRDVLDTAGVPVPVRNRAKVKETLDAVYPRPFVKRTPSRALTGFALMASLGNRNRVDETHDILPVPTHGFADMARASKHAAEDCGNDEPSGPSF